MDLTQQLHHILNILVSMLVVGKWDWNLGNYITIGAACRHFGFWNLSSADIIRLLAQIIRCSSKVHEKERRRLRIMIENSDSDTLYQLKSNEPPVELVVNRSVRYVNLYDVKDVDDVLRACPNMGKHIHSISSSTPITVDNLLSLAQVLYNNHMLHVPVALNVNDVRDMKGILKAYPNFPHFT